MIDMASKQILPAVIKYTKTLAEYSQCCKGSMGADASCSDRDSERSKCSDG